MGNCNMNKNKSLRDEIMDVAAEILKADNGNIFPLDFFIIGIVKRSLLLWTGFDQLIRDGNFICAAPLIRLNLDNLLQLHASSIVSDPHNFSMKKIKGKQTSNFKDRNGNKMTDNYLARSLSEKDDFKWILNVYRETSGFVHFSDKHIFNSIEKIDGNNISFVLSDKMDITEFAKSEAGQAMLEISKGILFYLKSWSNQKSRNNNML